MMFLRYESFREYIRYYPVNTVLLAVMILVHVGFAIAAGITGISVLELKAVYGAFIKNVQFGIVPELWRYITSVFLHRDFGHLLFNSFALFVFAPPLERALGAVRYAVLFLFSGMFGNVFTMIFYNDVFSLGASGAVYGIFGAYLFYMVFRRRAMDEGSRKTMQILLIVGVIFSLVVPQVNVAAHIGGLAAGFVLTGLYARFLEGRSR